jgi:hypothetical protein
MRKQIRNIGNPVPEEGSHDILVVAFPNFIHIREYRFVEYTVGGARAVYMTMSTVENYNTTLHENVLEELVVAYP